MLDNVDPARLCRMFEVDFWRCCANSGCDKALPQGSGMTFLEGRSPTPVDLKVATIRSDRVSSQMDM